MKEPKRYELNRVCEIIEEDENGEYVLYADYMKLKEKYDKVKSELSWTRSPDSHGS